MIPDAVHAAVRTAYTELAGRGTAQDIAVYATHLGRRAVSVVDARAVLAEIRAADRAEQEARRLLMLPPHRRTTITIAAGTTRRPSRLAA